MDFFELKYLTIDTFYESIVRDNFTKKQAIGICYESMLRYLKGEKIERLIVLITIQSLAFEYSIETTLISEDTMEEVLNLSVELDLEEMLNENEMEYLEDDLMNIYCKYKEIKEKK